MQTATSGSSFIFDFLLYEKIDEEAMGSPLDRILASAFICHYEKEWLDNCPSHSKPILNRWYVDDIFALSSSKEHPQSFVDYMKKQHRHIKFTSKTEQSNITSNISSNITSQNN